MNKFVDNIGRGFSSIALGMLKSVTWNALPKDSRFDFNSDDTEALKSDWQAVGDDMQSAIEKYKKYLYNK